MVMLSWILKPVRHAYLFEPVIIDLLLATRHQNKTVELMCCDFNVIKLCVPFKYGDRTLKKGINQSYLKII